MALSTSDRVSLRILCLHCGQTTEKTVSWLIVRSSMACPTCSKAIDLQFGDNGFRIHELAEKCEAIDIALRETR